MAVDLYPYDAAWAQLFKDAEAELSQTGLFVWIEHIGSTSVPCLPAKPIIDIMAGQHEHVSRARLLRALDSLDYRHRVDASIDRESFWRDNSDGARTHHLHVVPSAATDHHDLLFRDRLGADPQLRAEYADLKRQLARRFATDTDRRRYGDGKTNFIQRAVDTERTCRGMPPGAPVYSRRP